VFEQAQRGRSWIGAVVMLALAGGVAAALLLPDRFDELLTAADRMARGVPLGASPFAESRRDSPYQGSPLAAALAAEAAWVSVDAESALAEADRIAQDVGWWLLEHTGEADVQAAEEALWDAGDADELFLRIATALRDARVVARRAHRLSEPEPVAEGQPVYVHPDDLPWLFAHVAWRLDLRAELVRSPVHHYLVFRDPDGEGSRAVEATCFRRVDALGNVVQSDQPSVGRRLVQPEHHYPTGVGGIRNPSPLPAGAYESFLDDDALLVGVVERLEERHGPVSDTSLCGALASAPGQHPRCEEAR